MTRPLFALRLRVLSADRRVLRCGLWLEEYKRMTRTRLKWLTMFLLGGLLISQLGCSSRSGDGTNPALHDKASGAGSTDSSRSIAVVSSGGIEIRVGGIERA